MDAYYGKPRQGKSYSVVANVIIPALKKGRTVYTNIPLTSECEKLGGEVIHYDNDVTLEYFVQCEKGSVIVIDEFWRFLPAGVRATDIDDGFRELLAMHGHLVNASGDTTTITLVSQSPSQINNFAKTLVNTAYFITKKKMAGITRYNTEVYTGKGATNCTGRADRVFLSKFDPAIFKFYKTSTMSDSGEAGKEEELDGRADVFKGWFFRYGLIFAFVGICYGVYTAYHHFATLGQSQANVSGSTSKNKSSGSAQQQKTKAPVRKVRELDPVEKYIREATREDGSYIRMAYVSEDYAYFSFGTCDSSIFLEFQRVGGSFLIFDDYHDKFSYDFKNKKLWFDNDRLRYAETDCPYDVEENSFQTVSRVVGNNNPFSQPKE